MPAAHDLPFRPRTHDDVLKRPFAPRRFGALPIPVPAYDAEPRVVWAINRSWLSHVIGAVDLLAQDDAWQGDDDQRYNAIQEAEKLMSQNILVVLPENIQYRRKPGTNDYTLQFSLDAGVTWNDTAYSFKGQPINLTSIAQDVLDENADVIGTFTKLDSSINPDTQISSSNYSLELSRAAFQGDAGLDGKSIEFDTPPSIEVDPNQPAQLRVTGDTDTVQVVQMDIPRPPTWTAGDVLPVLPNEPPTFDIDTDDNGDLIVDIGIPRAQKIISASAHVLPSSATPTVEYEENGDGDLIQSIGIPRGANGTTNGIDAVLPGLGDSKVYSLLVPADTLVNLPFRVPIGAVIDEITSDGYWTIHTAANDLVVGAAGTEILGVTEGNLRIGKKTDQLTGHFAFEEATGEHVFVEDTWVAFEMQKYYPTSFGEGWIQVTFRVSRPVPSTIVLNYDFGGSGVSSVESGEEFDLVLGAYGGFYNSQVIFSVPVNLELISVTGWTQGPYSGATWAYTRGNGSDGGFYPAPINVPGESCLKYGVNSSTAATVRLRATIA